MIIFLNPSIHILCTLRNIPTLNLKPDQVHVFRFRYFLEGATPDELKQLTAQQLQNTKLLRTKLSRLQVKGIIITPKSDLWINFETVSVTRLIVDCHLVTL
jgi:hypothetical protein